MAEKPLWQRIAEASEEIAKDIPKEVMQKAEALICEAVCIEVKDGVNVEVNDEHID